MYLIPQLKGEEKLEYLRKSQTDDPLLTVEEVLEGHERRLDEWNERMQPEGGRVPEVNRYREIESGETIKGRPKMREMLRRIESPKIKAIMCVEPSRLSRGDLEDIGYLVKILRYTKTLVITPDYVYDLNDPGDRDRFERELMRGNDYLEYTKKIRMNGRLAKVRMGHFIGNCAPYGYKKKVIKDGKKDVHTLEPDPEKSEVVRRIFQLYLSGLGMTKISDYLNSQLIPPPTGKVWSPHAIPGVLQNVHYAGKVRWYWRRTVRVVEDGEVKTKRPRAVDPLVFEGLHDAIVEPELWEAVQKKRGKNPRNPNAYNLTNPLAGVFWCECGRAMSGRKYNNKGVKRCEDRYLCNNQRVCGNASATFPEVIEEVAKVLRATIADFEVRVDPSEDDALREHERLIARLEKRLEELQDLEVKQWDEKTKGGMPAHVFEKLNKQTLAEIDDVQHALYEAQETAPEPFDFEGKLITLRAALAALLDPDAPVREKNELIKACIEKITYSRERYSAAGTPKGMVPTPIRLNVELRF